MTDELVPSTQPEIVEYQSEATVARPKPTSQRIKITKTVVERTKAPHPSGRDFSVWDTELRGFGLWVSGVTNRRNFIVQRDVAGRTRRVTIGSVAEIDLEKAREEAADIIHGMRHGIDPKARASGDARATLQEVLNHLLANRHDLRKSTKDSYKDLVERYLKDWLNREMRTVTTSDVEAKHRQIQREIAAKYTDKKIAAPYVVNGMSTANGVMTVFSLLWAYWSNRVPDFPKDNPVRALRRNWFPTIRRERLIRADEMKTFYQAVDALPNKTASDVIKMMLFTGLRKGEVTALRWSEIDFGAGLIRLPASRMKSKRQHTQPMSDIVHDLLVARRALVDASSPWVFPSPEAKAGYLVEPHFALVQVQIACGIRVSPHDLRRSLATIAAGLVSGFALKKMLGHSDGGDVTSGYVHLSIEEIRREVQKVADRLKQLCGIEDPVADNVTKLAG